MLQLIWLLCGSLEVTKRVDRRLLAMPNQRNQPGARIPFTSKLDAYRKLESREVRKKKLLQASRTQKWLLKAEVKRCSKVVQKMKSDHGT